MDLKGQGKKDEIKEVKTGYAINFLIKSGYAVAYTDTSLKILDKEKEKREHDEEIEVKKCNEIKKKLENTSIKFKVKVGEKDKVFGSVSSKQIHEELKTLGYDIDKKKIDANDMNTLGFHNVKILLHKEVIANLKVELVKE
jgi:large subunit ribosomal protein L9